VKPLIAVLSLAILGTACTSTPTDVTAQPTTDSTTSTTPQPVSTQSTVGESDTEDSKRISDLEQELAWKNDLHSLLIQIDRIHPNPYWRITQGEFDSMAAFLWSDISKMTSDEITVEFTRLMATIDGHTGLQTFALGWDFAYLHLYRFGDDVVVLRAEDESLVGGKILAIDDTPIDEAWDLASPLSSFDNPATVDLITPIHFIIPRVMAALGVVSDATAPIYAIEKLDGSVVSHTPTVSDRATRASAFGAPIAALPQSELSPYLARRTEPFWWAPLEDGTVYAQYNSVTTGSFAIDDMRAALAAGPGRFVLDMRHNGGGDNSTYSDLLTFLVEEFADQCGLFVITGRSTFSAAVNLSTELDVQTKAVFVGEPTGGSPNLYGDTAAVRLNHSGLVVRISARYWEIGGPNDSRVWIDPEIPTPPSAANYFSGRDAALEAAVAAPLCDTDE
jgi:hypothetical protein